MRQNLFRQLALLCVFVVVGGCANSPLGSSSGDAEDSDEFAGQGSGLLEGSKGVFGLGGTTSTNQYLTSGKKPVYDPAVKRDYRNSTRATREDFVDQNQEDGSLWGSSGQTNYFFTKNRVKAVGDMISVTVEDDLLKEIFAEVKRTLSVREKNDELNRVQRELNESLINDQLTTTAASANVNAPAANENPGVPKPKVNSARLNPIATLDDVDLSKSLDVKTGVVMMGEVVERFANGNYKVRAVKKIPYKRGPSRVITVTGIVKNTDINEESDIIRSGRLYDYQVEVAR